MVECNLAKVDVAGSSPVSRSISFFSGPLAQLVEQVTLNHKVAGSIPARPTMTAPYFQVIAIFSALSGFFVSLSMGKRCNPECRNITFGERDKFEKGVYIYYRTRNLFVLNI